MQICLAYIFFLEQKQIILTLTPKCFHNYLFASTSIYKQCWKQASKNYWNSAKNQKAVRAKSNQIEQAKKQKQATKNEKRYKWAKNINLQQWTKDGIFIYLHFVFTALQSTVKPRKVVSLIFYYYFIVGFVTEKNCKQIWQNVQKWKLLAWVLVKNKCQLSHF